MASSSDGPVLQPRVVYVRPAPSNPLKVDKLAVRYLVLGLLLTVTCKLTMDYYINNHMVATTDGRDAQLRERMEHTLQALLAPGKGILAADESLPTMSRRFEQVGLPANDSNVRAAWRRVILTAPGLEDYISGVILTEETLRQTQGAGLDPLASLLRSDSSGNAGHKGHGAGGGGASIGQHGSTEAHGGSGKAEGGGGSAGVGGSEGVVPSPSWTRWPLPFNLTSRKIRVGVKVDLGTRPFSPGSGAAPGEVYTEGLEGLEARCWQYIQLAASFTKWRAVFHMSPVAADLGQGSVTQASGQGSDEAGNVVVEHGKEANGDEQSNSAVNREADGVADGQGRGEEKGDRLQEGDGADEGLGWEVDAIVEEAEDDPSTWDWGGEWRRHEAIHAAAQRRGELLQMQRRLTRHMSPQQLQQLQQQVLQQQQQEQQGLLRRRRPRPSSAAGATVGVAQLLQRPSLAALRHNAADLAEFAAASQRAGIVPIVEPELLLQLPASCSCTQPPLSTPEASPSGGAPAHLDEGEAFAAAAAATRRVLRAVAAALAAHPSVKTDLVIMKPNMVLQPSSPCPPCPSHPSSHASSTDSATDATHQSSDERSPEVHGKTGFQAEPESDAKQPGVKDALTPSSAAATAAMADRVAVATVEALKELRTLLPSLPGVAFLSGGQSPEEAARNLHAISLSASQTAWAQPATEQQQQQPERGSQGEQQREAGSLALTFSFGRALLQPPLDLWAAGLRAEAEAAAKAAEDLESPAHQGEVQVAQSGDEGAAGKAKGMIQMDSQGEMQVEGKGEAGEREGEGEGRIGGDECPAAGDATEEGWCRVNQGAQRTASQQQQQLQQQQQQQQLQQHADRQERMRQLEQRAQAELLRWCEANSRAVQGQDPLA